MSTATFIGDGDVTCVVVKVYGLTFPLNEPVDTSELSAERQAKLAGNPTFSVGDKPKGGRKPKAEVAEPDGGL